MSLKNNDVLGSLKHTAKKLIRHNFTFCSVIVVSATFSQPKNQFQQNGFGPLFRRLPGCFWRTPSSTALQTRLCGTVQNMAVFHVPWTCSVFKNVFFVFCFGAFRGTCDDIPCVSPTNAM